MKIVIEIDNRKIIDKLTSQIEDDLIDTVKENFIESLNDDVLDDIDFDDCITVEAVDNNNVKQSTIKPVNIDVKETVNDENFGY